MLEGRKGRSCHSQTGLGSHPEEGRRGGSKERREEGLNYSCQAGLGHYMEVGKERWKKACPFKIAKAIILVYIAHSLVYISSRRV